MSKFALAVGQAIEAVTGQDLAAYLQEHVFTPLGMNDATFDPSEDQRARLMAIHERTPDGGLAVSALDVPVRGPEIWPAGHGAYGTATDYARFMAALGARVSPVHRGPARGVSRRQRRLGRPVQLLLLDRPLRRGGGGD